ncbi:MAG TPA: glycosyltransferase family 2 protein [Acidimicrobiia bacterium]|nr:glycosyltransferase family 2 protein [Acidimicrobiia bacterium]
MSIRNDVAFIIPVFNEGPVIAGVIKKVLDEYSTVICVNDGSSDDTNEQIGDTDAVLINHPINMGQGASLQTGIEYALTLDHIKYFVTFDADGQHQLEDVDMMVKYLEEHPKVDITLGSRFLGKAENMSQLKRIVLKLAIFFSNTTSGLKLTDAHNGLRVFNRHVAETLDITMNDMAHASEIVEKIKQNKYAFQELPCTIIYTEYSKAKGQAVMNAVNISFDLILRKLTK